MSRFTVLGANGYIGSRLAAHLRKQGHEVETPRKGDPRLCDQPMGHVMYCIGLTGDFRFRPFDTVEAHVSALSEVLQQARFDSLTYLSSTRVYMDSPHTDEDAPLTVRPDDPSHLYNLSKLMGESMCHSSGREGIRVVRLSNVVGPGMDPRSGNFVASLIQEATTGRITLQGHPESAKDYIHVDDVVDFLSRLALEGRHRSYNLASGVQLTHRHWADWVVRRFGGSWTSIPGAPRQSMAPINITRLRSELSVQSRPADMWT